MSRRIARSLLKRYAPFDRISVSQLATIQQHCIAKTVKSGRIVLRQKDTIEYQCFLISGQIEVRLSFEERFNVDQDSTQSQQPLNDLLTNRGFIRAQSNCKILMVETAVINNLRPANQKQYGITHLNDSDAFHINNHFNYNINNNDWIETLLQSPLTRTLTPKTTAELFRELEEIEVCRTQKIITPQTTGDFFYIIKQGKARVVFDAFGPESGEFTDLGPGNYFGDEGLVSNAAQNITVVMKTEGTLMRLPREKFERLIKPALLNTIDMPKVLAMVSKRAQQIQKMDVRFSIETRTSKHRDRIDVPITHLHSRLKDLQPKATYIVGPENDCRSALGAYMLRRAGFEAYYLVSANNEGSSLDPES